MQLPSFIFNAQTATPEEMARRRALAEALLNRGQTGVASNVGEGLAQLGQALAGRFKLGAVNRTEAANRSKAYGMLGGMFGAPATPSTATPVSGGTGSDTLAGGTGSPDIASGIVSTASAMGIDPVDLATAISYETAGTFNPTKGGPTTKWGKHRGLIQFGEPQAQKYGVDWKNPVGSQLGPEGAVAKYLRDAGVKPGMGMMDIYSAINAGRVGRYGASDAAAGGAPGTVADKVNNQMAGHREKARALLAAVQNSGAMPAPSQAPSAPMGTAMTGFPSAPAPMPPQMAPQAPQIVPTAGPAPQAPQMAPQAPMTAYQRMMATSLGKEAGGLSAPPNRAQMASVMGQGGQPSGGGILSNIFAGIGGGGQPPAASPFAPPASGQQMQPPISGNSGNPGAAPAGNRLGQLQSVISSPQFAWLDPAQQKFVIEEYERERAAANPDPRSALELENLRLDIKKKSGRDTTVINGALVDTQTGEVIYRGGNEVTPTDDMRELAQINAERKAAGQPPMSTEEWIMRRTNAGAAKNNSIGTIPPGYEVKYDEQGRAVSMSPLPGSPAAAEVDKMSSVKSAVADKQARLTDTITGAAQKARELAGYTTTGPIGQGLSFIGASDAAEVYRQVGVLKSVATIENLNAMRRESPTGGALGNVTEKEGAMLAAAAGALDPAAGPQRFNEALDNYELTLLQTIHGYDAGTKVFNDMKAAKTGNNQITQSPAPQSQAAPAGDVTSQTLSAIKQYQGFTSDQQALDYIKKKQAEGWTVAPNGVMYQEVK